MPLIAGFFDSPAELGVVLILWIPFIAVGGVVGYLIGRGKGRGTEGIWLGILLGCVGWVITAVLSPNSAKMPQVLPQVSNPTSTPPSSGWHPDPYRRFQLRYHNGAEWTDQVATDQRQYTDPPTP